eukprot:7230026-Lingulodinium_polyedra.AAC.1
MEPSFFGHGTRACGADQGQGPDEPSCSVVVTVGDRRLRVRHGSLCGVGHVCPRRPAPARGPSREEGVALADKPPPLRRG